jgi:hypothetical protein
MAAAIAPDATATVAWSGIAGRGFPHLSPARVATTGASWRFGAPATLAPTDQIFASRRPAGAPGFAASEAVGAPERAGQPRAAFDPVTHRPSVVWIGGALDTTLTLRVSTRGG